ncbi:MAG TPA: hypothetical protein GX505_02240 [Clostridiales bacterium]|nr:hypothetical protein [Clostridiales bacterium]
MKKMILGAALFVAGFFGAIALIVSTVLYPLNPWNYNGIEGWYAVVMGMHLEAPLIASIVISVVGLAVCISESLHEDK